MKKFLVLVLVLMMVFTTFTACGGNDDAVTDGDQIQQDQPVDGDIDADADAEQQPVDENEGTEEENTEEPADKEEEKKPEADKKEENKKEDNKKEESKPSDKKEENKKEESKPAPSYSNAVDLLKNVWKTYSENEMFPAGYMDEEGNMIDGPAKISTADGEVLDSLLGVPADKAGSIGNASIMMHMMNANTFTGGAFKTSDAKGLSNAIKDNLVNRQWMCGFPDTLVTIQVGDYLISAFGNAELIENFKKKVTKTYSNAKVLCEEPLAF